MIYSLDTNVFIEAWNKYYAFEICPDYWDKLDQLAKGGIIFATEEVKRDIAKKDDNLYRWIESRDHLFRSINDYVQDCLRRIFETEAHRRLIDSSKFRSTADPWVIAHAMAENAVVVTKEKFETHSTKRIKIPNVCKAMGVECIDDFELIRRLGIKFSISAIDNQE